MGRVLPKRFYERDPAEVAESLLGKILVRLIDGSRLSGMIVETEAYYGPEDPASRARKGGELRKMMFGEPGVALIYGLHRQWLLNVVSHEPGEAGAVLIRGCEPLEGLDVMRKLRGARDERLLMAGPGRLTKALAIDKSFHGKPLYVKAHGLWMEKGHEVQSSMIGRSHRIGVSEDLPIPLRFYLRGSRCLSRRRRAADMTQGSPPRRGSRL
ncbi:MAG TPA: DNA-3-methyladenine glycosylase [Nitrososphaeria archaeon]|nr:DNA-3-methyladenine glycosylase [Nitrososphaeria archaeon]